jgi:hypothetical protein
VFLLPFLTNRCHEAKLAGGALNFFLPANSIAVLELH